MYTFINTYVHPTFLLNGSHCFAKDWNRNVTMGAQEHRADESVRK